MFLNISCCYVVLPQQGASQRAESCSTVKLHFLLCLLCEVSIPNRTILMAFFNNMIAARNAIYQFKNIFTAEVQFSVISLSKNGHLDTETDQHKWQAGKHMYFISLVIWTYTVPASSIYMCKLANRILKLILITMCENCNHTVRST